MAVETMTDEMIAWTTKYNVRCDGGQNKFQQNKVKAIQKIEKTLLDKFKCNN